MIHMPAYRIRELWAEKERLRGEPISWRQLAQESGLPLSIIQKLMKDEHVSTRTLESLAAYFEVDLPDLFHRSQPYRS